MRKNQFLIGLSIILFILMSYSSVFAEITFADVALYKGQRNWSQTPSDYQKKSIKEVKKMNSRFFEEYEVHSGTIESNGCEIGFLNATKSNANKEEKPPVIFFYGNAMDSYDTLNRMSEIENSLLNKGYDIWIMDYPGFGLSNCSPNEESLVAAGKSFLSFVVESSNQNPIVIGYSLGGGVASQAVEGRADIKKLLLVSTFSDIHSVIDHLHEVYGTFKFRMASKLKGGPFLGDELEALLSVKKHNSYNSLEHLKGIKIPVFLVHGTIDNTIPVEHFSELKESLTQDGACLKASQIETVNHSGLFERKKSQSGFSFWKEILSFVESEEISCLQ